MIIHRIYADEAIDTSLHQFNGILDNITETNHEELYIDRYITSSIQWYIGQYNRNKPRGAVRDPALQYCTQLLCIYNPAQTAVQLIRYVTVT